MVTSRRHFRQYRRSASHSAFPRLLFLEALEDRALLAVTFVDINPDNSDLDSGGNPDPANLQAADPDGASGGRVNGLASVTGNNQIFYAASEWGGLYKTTDAGLTWNHLSNHLPLATKDIEVDPSDVNRVYATSWYDGRVSSISGIQVSTDAGANWTHPLTATPALAFENTPSDNTPQTGFTCANANARTEPRAYGVSIQPDAPQNVFIGTNCGLARSTDSGVTWQFLDPTTTVAGTAANPAGDVLDVVAQAGGIIDVLGTAGHSRSTDGGNTWVVSTNLPNTAFAQGGNIQPLGSMAVSPDENYVVYVVGVDNVVYENTNAQVAGTAWNNLGNPSPQGRFSFVATNQRANDGAGNNLFDLWFGDVSLHRRPCTTPTPAAPGGASRCPALPQGTDGINNDGDQIDTDGDGFLDTPLIDEADESWLGQDGGGAGGGYTRALGAHDDAGDIVFDTAVAVDACPEIFSSDGGVYYNTDNGADCHNPNWEQPNVTPHATWLWAMAGVDRPGNLSNEDLYFGVQDDGSWVSTDAGAADPTWSNKDCCDVFDVVADTTRVVYDVCCGFTVFQRNNGMTGGGAIATNPPGNVPAFFYPDFIDQFGPNQYVAVTTGGGGGAFTTNNIAASPVVWTPLGANAPANGFCSVQVSIGGGQTAYYAQTGCGPDAGNQVWRFNAAISPNWQQIDNNDGLGGGFGIFAVDPVNPNRLYASNFPVAGGVQMVFSTDGEV